MASKKRAAMTVINRLTVDRVDCIDMWEVDCINVSVINDVDFVDL